MNPNKSEKSRRKIVLQNIVLVFSSSIIFLVFLEIIFRLLGYGNLVIYQPDRNLFWKPVPNQTCYTKVAHKPVHINDKGTRGQYFSKIIPQNTFRVLSLGDSRTFGWGLADSETYSALLENLLQEQVGNKLKVEVINAGVNAWSYGQMYVYLRDIGMRYNPDMVIIGDANLWTQFSEDSSNEFIEKMTRGVRVKNLLRRSAIYHYLIEVKLKKYYEKYRTKFIPVDPEKDQFFKEQQKSNPFIAFEDQLLKICELLQQNSTRGLIIYIPIENKISLSQKDSILQIKKKVRDKYNIPFIDLTEDFSISTNKLFLPDDPVHPNVEGNRIIANRLAQLIKVKVKK